MPQKRKLIRRRVVVGKTSDGKPVEKSYSGFTTEELERNKRKVLTEYSSSFSGTVRTDVVYRYYLQTWYDAFVKPYIGGSQRINYGSAINKHILPVIGDKQIRAISPFDLQAILNSLIGRSDTLIGDVYYILTKSFAHAAACRAVDADPAQALRKPEGVSGEDRRPLTNAETLASFALMETHPDGLFLAEYYYLGIRPGEALGGIWDDIDWKREERHVLRDVDYRTNSIHTLKSDAAERILPIHPNLMRLYRAHRGLPGAFIHQAPNTGSFFPKSTYTRKYNSLRIALLEQSKDIDAEEIITGYRYIAKRDKNGKVLTGKDGKPITEKKVDTAMASVLTGYYYRHNFATILYYQNVDVLRAAYYMGHADPTTMLRIYAHLNKEKELQDGGKQLRTAFDQEYATLFNNVF